MADIIKTTDGYQIAIISDIHIGDTRCTIFNYHNELVDCDNCTKGIYYHDDSKTLFNFPHDKLVMQKLEPAKFVPVEVDASENSSYKKLISALKGVDCLIILGDLFDLAVQRNDIVYALVSKFLHRLQKDVGHMEYIFVPGNHDYSLWRSLQWEIGVIQKLNIDKLAIEARHDVPGIISFNNDSKLDLSLYKYTDTIITGKDKEDNSQYDELSQDASEYGTTHLNHLFKNQNGENPIRIMIAYPNLYITPLENPKEVIMLTHGHYFEDKWTGMSNSLSEGNYNNFAAKMAKKFNLNLVDALTNNNDDGFFINTYNAIREEVSNLNIAQQVQTNTINCSIQSGVTRESNNPAKLFDLFLQYSKLYPLSPKPIEKHEAIYDSTEVGFDLASATSSECEHDKYSKQYKNVSKTLISNENNNDNVSNYLRLSNEELHKLTNDNEYSIKKLIYGHTHVPGCSNYNECIVGLELKHLNKIGIESYNVINTGCWLNVSEKSGKPDENKSSLIPILKNGKITELKYLELKEKGI